MSSPSLCITQLYVFAARFGNYLLLPLLNLISPFLQLAASKQGRQRRATSNIGLQIDTIVSFSANVAACVTSVNQDWIVLTLPLP